MSIIKLYQRTSLGKTNTVNPRLSGLELPKAGPDVGFFRMSGKTLKPLKICQNMVKNTPNGYRYLPPLGKTP